jgi:hypothetical protein
MILNMRMRRSPRLKAEKVLPIWLIYFSLAPFCHYLRAGLLLHAFLTDKVRCYVNPCHWCQATRSRGHFNATAIGLA